MSDAPLHSHLQPWLAARPARLACMPFLRPEDADAACALAALEQAVLGVLADVREPQVADAKLRWWVEEMAAVPAGTARHPLTQVLARHAAAGRMETALWKHPGEAALAVVAAATPVDDAAQWAQALAVCAPWAALEAAWWRSPGVDSDEAAQAAALAWLVGDLLRLPQRCREQRLPLPMQRLARHALARDDLAADTPARRAAVREQCAALAAHAAGIRRENAALPLLRGFDLRLDARALRQVAHHADPLPALAHRHGDPGPFALLAAWQAARASRAGAGLVLPART